jgi:CheY-like chemotaxis protein
MTKTILVVDDDAQIRESLEDALKDEGYAVVTAANGLEAVDLLPRLERPCAVVLDLIMPVMSGPEFYRAMQADPRFSDLPVLVTTSDPSRAPEGLVTLRKPIGLDRFLATLKTFFPDDDPRGGAGGGPGIRRWPACSIAWTVTGA